MKQIQMVDLSGQYQKLQGELDKSIHDVLSSCQYINGPEVLQFENNLATFLNVNHVVSCANGTDALQIALMALELEEGDEVIIPSFNYISTVEVVSLLRLKPVFVDVDPFTFNLSHSHAEEVITEKTRVIVPVHLFGQCADMQEIMKLATEHNLYVIEDNAQALGVNYKFSNGQLPKAGTIGHIGCTSFFPTKMLGCFGDGGAVFTNDQELSNRMAMIASHGQKKKYQHEKIGINSRLDTIQAAILNIKLQHLDSYIQLRRNAAEDYNKLLDNIPGLSTPFQADYNLHIYNQYTLQIFHGKRDLLQSHLSNNGIPSKIYYPIPLYKQRPYSDDALQDDKYNVTEELCHQVLSIPMHTELSGEQIGYICDSIISFFDQ